MMGLKRGSLDYRSAFRCSIITSSVMLTLQALALIGTLVLYWFASSDTYRDFLAKPIMTSLYPSYQWVWLRRQHIFELHVLISGGIQGGLLMCSLLLMIGLVKRLKFLMLPWLVISGLFQVALLYAVVASALYIPSDFKLLGVAVMLMESLVIFPWWFAVFHVFALMPSRSQNSNASPFPSTISIHHHHHHHHPDIEASSGPRGDTASSRCSRASRHCSRASSSVSSLSRYHNHHHHHRSRSRSRRSRSHRRSASLSSVSINSYHI